MILNDPKLPYDSWDVSKLNGVVGGSMLGREIVSLPNEKLAKWIKNASHVPKEK
jgi:hypothetical protein